MWLRNLHILIYRLSSPYQLADERIVLNYSILLRFKQKPVVCKIKMFEFWLKPCAVDISQVGV